MAKSILLKIDENSNFRYIKCTKFKTASISFNMFLPLKSKSASIYSVIPGILEYNCALYPDFVIFNKRLEELYGASVESDVYKIGDYQVLGITLSSLDERFIINNLKIFDELVDLLIEIIFRPNFSNGIFLENVVNLEKRQITELIQSEINDKRLWALINCEKLMYDGQDSCVNKYGTIEEIKQASTTEITNGYYSILERSHIEITMIASSSYETVYEKFKKEISNLKRDRKLIFKNIVNSSINSKIKEKKDIMEIEQSKLVMGFNTGVSLPDDVTDVILMTAFLGGSPNSRLFLNVREKLNLCYYCSAKYDKHKGSIFIESGVEHTNLEKAKNEILNQIQDIKLGFIEDEEIEEIKRYMSQMYKNIEDRIDILDTWYTYNNIYEKCMTPTEMSEKINKITKDQIKLAADKLNLDSIYILSNK